jgi:ferredoxin-NADP reductase
MNADMTTQPHELIDVRLVGIRYAARDIHLYEFQRLDESCLPSSTPGSHIDIHLDDNLVRQYSLINAEEAPMSYTIGVKRDLNSRGGSSFMHDKLKLGTVLKISPPRNNFPLDEAAEYSVLIAGGIGITPIWCMWQRLQSLGKSCQLYYSCRTSGDAAFYRSLKGKENVHLHIDEQSTGKFLDLTHIVDTAPPGAHFYCCGPLPMLAAYEAATASLPRHQVHVEYFTSKHGVATDGGYIVELAASGKSFEVTPGKTILQILREAGFVVPSSCEEGLCGACETRLLKGEADHRDSILTPSERRANNTIMICCSGAKSERLVLDL